MKKLFIIAALTAILGATTFAFHHGGCAPGNSEVLFGNESGTTYFTGCCVSVGDGSELSCDAGGCLFNAPTSGGFTPPECAVPQLQ